MTVYRVTGTRHYRGHQPGAQFEATLTPDVEGRALRRRDIEVIDDSTTTIQPGSYQLPDGWQPTAREE